MTAHDEFKATEAEYEGQVIREAVEKAKALVEGAKSHAKSASWRTALEKLVLKYHRRLPRTMVKLEHSSLSRPMTAWTLSLDPADTKYWCYGGVLYSRHHFDSHARKPGPTELQCVYLANVPEEDAPAILKVIETVLEHDLSSQVFIPKGTALFEYESFVQLEGEKEGKWSDRRCEHELYVDDNTDLTLNLSEDHLFTLRGVSTVRNARLYMPGLNQVVNLRVDGKHLFVARQLAQV